MERADIFFKAAVGIVGSTISYIVGGLGWAVVILFCLMVADFVTGMIASVVNGQGLSSAIGKKGLARKTYILILVGLVYLIEIATGKTGGIIGDGVAWAYAAMELISVIENGGKMGVYIPPQIRGLITVLKGKASENNDQTYHRP